MLYGGMHFLPRTPESCLAALGIRAGLKLLVKASVGIATRHKRSTPAARWFKFRLNRGGSLCLHLVNHENHQHSFCVIGSVPFCWPCIIIPYRFKALWGDSWNNKRVHIQRKRWLSRLQCIYAKWLHYDFQRTSCACYPWVYRDTFEHRS